jgi:hypothetical protein
MGCCDIPFFFFFLDPAKLLACFVLVGEAVFFLRGVTLLRWNTGEGIMLR